MIRFWIHVHFNSCLNTHTLFFEREEIHLNKKIKLLYTSSNCIKCHPSFLINSTKTTFQQLTPSTMGESFLLTSSESFLPEVLTATLKDAVWTSLDLILLHWTLARLWTTFSHVVGSKRYAPQEHKTTLQNRRRETTRETVDYQKHHHHRHRMWGGLFLFFLYVQWLGHRSSVVGQQPKWYLLNSINSLL